MCVRPVGRQGVATTAPLLGGPAGRAFSLGTEAEEMGAESWGRGQGNLPSTPSWLPPRHQGLRGQVQVRWEHAGLCGQAGQAGPGQA